MEEKYTKNQVHYKVPIPLTEQVWASDITPLVSISCTTYNHERYLPDAIKGFLIQETTFPVEILIHDDASTDETPNIIRKYEALYPQLIKPIYQMENQYSKRDGTIGRIQRGRARGKYYATCEGDDYWIDPLKLQKQVDFLENNPQYSFCCHRYKIYNEGSGVFSDEPTSNLYESSDLIINLELFSKAWVTKTLTAVIRREFLIEILPDLQKYKHSKDVHLFYYLLKKGNAISLNQVMGVYRKHDGGVFNRQSKLAKAKTGYEIYKELWEYNQSDKFLRNKFKVFIIQYLSLSNRIPFSVYRTGLKISCSFREKLGLTKVLFRALLPLSRKIE